MGISSFLNTLRLSRLGVISVLMLWPMAANALEIIQSAGVSDQKPYLLLELRSANPFSCELSKPTRDSNGSLQCHFDRVPALRPHPLHNRFFSIEPLLSDRHFSVEIRFHQNATVYPLLEKTLSDRPLVPSELGRQSDRWLVVGYNQEPPFLTPQKARGLSFGVTLPPFEPPTVGALDTDGSPISSTGSDATLYSQALATYRRGELPEALRMTNQALDLSREHSLFLPELLALKLRILDELEGSEVELIEIAEHWVRAYTTHADLPEMMLLLTRGLIGVGRTGDAFYYADLLIREFPDSPYADMAIIYKSDRFLAEGRVGEAVHGYETVLFNSQDIPAAALAASRLAEMAIREDELDRAAALYEKILLSHPPFFFEDPEKSEALLIMLGEHRLIRPAALLGAVLIKERDEADEAYAGHLKDLARSQSLADMREMALASYKRYLDLFPFSEDLPTMTKEHDLLEFELGVEGVDEQLALFERIIKRYPADEAASRALYEKAKLLLQLGRYQEVAELMPSLDRLDPELFSDFSQQIRQMERTLLNSFIIQDRCQEAVALINTRHLGISLRSDEALYHCAWQQHDHQLATEIIDHQMRLAPASKTTQWLERRLDVQRATSALPAYLDNAEHYLRIHRALRWSVAPERYYEIFSMHHRSQDALGQMRSLAQEIERRHPRDARNIDLFAAMVDLARAQEDGQLLYTYAKKLVNHQRLLGVATLTPFAELAFAEGAIAQNRPTEAIVVLQTLLQEELSGADRARVLYRLGEVLESDARMDMAAAVYGRCADLDLEGDEWANLCRERAAL